MISGEKSEFEYIVWKMAAILFRPQDVKRITGKQTAWCIATKYARF